jgi:hypothetical protein
MREAEQRYGKLYRDYSWEHADKFLVTADLSMFHSLLDRVTVNRDIIIPLYIVMQTLHREGLIDEITEFKGCYNTRPVQGTNRPSVHAYGLGCDFDNNEFSPEFVKVWKDQGWTWGGDWKKYDPMHFSYAWED